MSQPGAAPLLTPPRIKALLAAHGLAPNRWLGQNYLADPNTARKVARVGGAGPGQTVLEVGPGLGSLTLALREAGARVVAVELDTRLLPVLRAVLGADLDGPEPGVRVVLADAMKADLGAIAPEAGALIANLPYSIAAPLILRVLADVPGIGRLTAMVQKEVGERLAARPGQPAYGGPSVKVAALADAAVAAPISRRVFMPEPRVDSVLVTAVRRERPEVLAVGYPALARVVDAAFAQRRKTLRNALKGLGLDAGRVEAACRAAGVDPGERAERLDVAAFAALTAAVASA
jgi:16S rRNA (adenine1518-N6/adenine1519-N6)-dimethyltransferase